MLLTESTVEEAALSWFRDLGYTVEHALRLAPGEVASERISFTDVVLSRRLSDAIERLNSNIPSEAREVAFRKIVGLETPSLIGNNRRFHQILRNGVEVEYRRDDGSIAGDS